MIAYFYVTTSNTKKLVKDLAQVDEKNILWKENTDILSPTIRIGGTLTSANYCYIPDFGRYYFIKERVMQGANVFELDLEVDVLMTYADSIKELPCVVKRQENQYNTYLNDAEFLTYNYPSVEQHQFPYGFTGNSHLVLAIAGGSAT